MIVIEEKSKKLFQAQCAWNLPGLMVPISCQCVPLLDMWQLEIVIEWKYIHLIFNKCDNFQYNFGLNLHYLDIIDFVIHILIWSLQNWFFYQNCAISWIFRGVPLWCYSSRLMKYWGIMLYQKVWSKKPIRMFPVSWGEIKRSPPSLLGYNFSSWF